jgi:hypothetical protein
MTHDEFLRGAIGAAVMGAFPFLRLIVRRWREKWRESRSSNRRD